MYTIVINKTSFINTPVEMNIQGIRSTLNYAKMSFGFIGSKNKWDYGVKINALYGNRFWEAGANITLDKRF